MDPYRLPRHVVPTRYDLRLEPDLASATFTGEETITVTVTEPTSEIVVNAVDLTIAAVTLLGEGSKAVAGRATFEPETERCRLTFDARIEPGTWRLGIRFAGALNDKLRGFYRSSYKDPTGVVRTLAATQFEATDARRAFPCWDEPAFKAIFGVTLVVDPAFSVVSNTRAITERAEGSRKLIRFADTIRMSTYLVAFVVGELEATDPVSVGRTPLRVWCVPGKKRLAAFGQDIAAFSLQFFEDYYGHPYPGDKLDLLAIPDFAAGAMENLGAITFRETALLVDPAQATHTEIERVADVVAHENAHMWFGDLVTMTWWNGIWLNEAFATFMEMLAVDAWKPEWHRWTTFGASRAAAFAVDGLWSTRPIEFPVCAPRDADAMFDVLTYEKGASVLRMLEQHLGAQVFREGVRQYLRAHTYGNADTGDLWSALGQAADQPIPDMMDAWIFHPGHPLLTVTQERNELVVAQRRFTYLPSPPGESSVGPTDERWRVPVQVDLVAGGQRTTSRLLLTEREARLALPSGFEAAIVNAGGHGFYRVRYSPELLTAALRLVPERLDAIDRFNLVNDAWAATLAGLMSVAQYLELTARFREDRDRNVWSVILGSLHGLNRIVDPAARRGLEAVARQRVSGAVLALGWEPRTGEDELTRQLRGDLLRALGTLGADARAQAKAAELYDAHARGAAPVDANVLPALIAILAHVGDETRYAEFLERFRTAATPQAEQRYLYALAGFRQPELVEATLERTVNGEIRTQDAPFVVRAMLMGVHSREASWEFVKRRWETMDRLYPKHGLRRMCEGVVALATAELERDVHAFFAERRIDLGGKTLQQYLEQLRIAVALREREAARLTALLGAGDQA